MCLQAMSREEAMPAMGLLSVVAAAHRLYSHLRCKG